MEKKDRKLPIYTLVLKDDAENSGFNYVALTDEPAIERNWFAFNKEMKFSIDEERKIITGPLIIADLPIYRRTDEMGEFYVVFDKTQTELMVQKFMRMGYQNNVNEQHDPNKIVEGVTMFEIFIVDSQRGIKAPEGFNNITEGSVFCSYKIDNEVIWGKVKDGTFMGYSVEGFFDLVPQEPTLESQIISIIDSIQE